MAEGTKFKLPGELHVSVATTRAAVYRQAMAYEVWSLLHDLFRDLRSGARGKSMTLTSHLEPLGFAGTTLDELADVLYKEMRDRGIDIDNAFGG